MSSFTLFQPVDSGLHRLHPLTKLAISGLNLIVAVALPDPWWALGYFFLVMLPLAFWGRLGKHFLLTCAKLIWPFVLSLFLIQGFFTHGERILFTLGPLSMKMEGIDLAFNYAARILQGLGAATLLMFVTRPDHLMQALTESGFPYQLGYIIVTTMQIIPRFQAKAEMILSAQQSRGLETQGTVVHRARMLLPLVAPLIMGSIIDIDERAIALEARAFNYPTTKTSFHVLDDSHVQARTRWALLVLTVLSPLLRIFG